MSTCVHLYTRIASRCTRCAHSLATVLSDFHLSLVHIKSFCSTSLTHATTPVLSMKLNARYFNKKNWAFSFLFRIGPSYPNCAPGVLSNWLKRPRREASQPSPSRVLVIVTGIVQYLHSLLCPHGLVVKRQLWRVHLYVFQTVAVGKTWRSKCISTVRYQVYRAEYLTKRKRV